MHISLFLFLIYGYKMHCTESTTWLGQLLLLQVNCHWNCQIQNLFILQGDDGVPFKSCQRVGELFNIQIVISLIISKLRSLHSFCQKSILLDYRNLNIHKYVHLYIQKYFWHTHYLWIVSSFPSLYLNFVLYLILLLSLHCVHLDIFKTKLWSRNTCLYFQIFLVNHHNSSKIIIFSLT